MMLPREVQEEIDALQKEIWRLKEVISKLETKQESLRLGVSPIQPGDIIEWVRRPSKVERDGSTSSPVLTRGRVVGMDDNGFTSEFTYRCEILNQKGKAVGMANVSESKEPKLIKKAEKPKMPSRAKARLKK